MLDTGCSMLDGVRQTSRVFVHKRTSEHGCDCWSKAFCDKGLGVSRNQIAARILVDKTRIHLGFSAQIERRQLLTNSLDRGAHRERLTNAEFRRTTMRAGGEWTCT